MPFKEILPARGLLTFVGEQVELAVIFKLTVPQTNVASRGGLLAHGAFTSSAARENDLKLSSNGDISLIGSGLYPGSLSDITIESTAPKGTVEIASKRPGGA